MKIRVEKTVEVGREVVKYFINEQESSYGREATGHASGSGSELFNEDQQVNLYYANTNKIFNFNSRFLPADTPKERVEKILDRIEMVRSWVDNLKRQDQAASGIYEAEIADLPEITESLRKEARLYYRGKDGKFKRIE